MNLPRLRIHWHLALLIICVIAHLALATRGWTHNILDQHPFRQTQTAITVRSLLQGGSWLRYETPVLGKPWAVPIEFPTYQWIVAIVVRMTGVNPESAGRLVSLLAFYLFLPSVYSLAGRFTTDRERRLLLLCFLLASPMYIFWSRAFMIESLALSATLGFLALSDLAFRRSSLPLGVLATLLGCVAAGTKITTFAVAGVPFAAMLVDWIWSRFSLPSLTPLIRQKLGFPWLRTSGGPYRVRGMAIAGGTEYRFEADIVAVEELKPVVSAATTVEPIVVATDMVVTPASTSLPSYDLAAVLRAVAAGASMLVVPIVFARLWVAYSDAVKSDNPLAGFLLSSELWRWNFGSLSQRFSLTTWRTLLERWPEVFGGVGKLGLLLIVLFLGVALFKRSPLRPAAVVCALAFASGPAIFTNLYYIHNYYLFASIVFLLLLIGIGAGILTMSARPAVRVTTDFVLVPLLLILMFAGYTKTVYWPLQRHENQRWDPIARELQDRTQPNDVIVAYGYDWDPTLAYVSQRRALMERADLPLTDMRLIVAKRNLANERVGAMVVAGHNPNSGFIRDRAAFFGVDAQPVYRSDMGDIYLRRNP